MKGKFVNGEKNTVNGGQNTMHEGGISINEDGNAVDGDKNTVNRRGGISGNKGENFVYKEKYLGRGENTTNR